MKYSHSLLLALAILVVGTTAEAQERLHLDESCVVMVGNQRATVNADGEFFVTNIAVFQSRLTGVQPLLYRARATCIRDGMMITGQSDFFELEPGETTRVSGVYPTFLDPIPVRIVLKAPKTTLRLGETVPLSVLATFLDGTTEDRSSLSDGTVYLSTNPGLARVEAAGQVTNVRPETAEEVSALVIAINEGNVASLEFDLVGADPDFDRDGMDDEWEVLFGLDPFDRRDRYRDLDGDGLSNFREFERGTLPNDPDTDVDLIADGVDPHPLRPDEEPPEAGLLGPEGPVLRGDTVEVQGSFSDDSFVERIALTVEGVEIDSEDRLTFFLETDYTVPFGTDGLLFGATATDAAGKISVTESLVSVEPDPLTEVRGRVVDPDGLPVVGAEIEIHHAGLRAEFFDLEEPSDVVFPSLEGRTPDAERWIGNLDFLNPDGLFSDDTFGLGMHPDYLGRIRGELLADRPGRYALRLGAQGSARLIVDGTRRLDIYDGGSFHSGSTYLDLDAGLHEIEVLYSASFEPPAQLSLWIEPPGGDWVPVGREQSRPLSGLRSTASASDGSFAIAGVPTITGSVQAVARLATPDGDMLVGVSERVAPDPGGFSDVGTFEARDRLDILLYDDQCDNVGGTSLDPTISFYPTALRNLGFEELTLVETDAEFASALEARPWDLVIVDGALNDLEQSLPPLQSYVLGGGRVAMSYWGWAHENPGLAEAFDVEFVRGIDTFTLKTYWLQMWVADHPLLTSPNVLGDTLSGHPWSFRCRYWGAWLSPLAGAELLAGFDWSPNPTRGGLIVGNDGRTVVSSHLLGYFVEDVGPKNGRLDGLDIAENIVTFLVESLQKEP